MHKGTNAMDELKYLSGFGNHFATEALSDTLPQGQNSPQKVNHGLYAEQLSGSAFTAPKGQNLRSWLYRIHPSVIHGTFKPFPETLYNKTRCNAFIPYDELTPMQMRWNPLPPPTTPTTFIDSWFKFAGNGSVQQHQGATIYLYACNQSMEQEAFYCADGELLIVPQLGRLRFKTELGLLDVAPEEILVIPRGIKFQVQLFENTACGYICENHGLPFRLPERGLIGSNGLANERDFLYPTAAFENETSNYSLICKFLANFWQCDLPASPFNVVAWHGNYAPYKYALKNFNTINSVSFDHCDPSLFTVLTSASAINGTANIDFVIFPPRWMVAEHTFRPPYFHRNIMSELMGLIKGEYDAKSSGFIPGGVSIHNCMTAHGSDTQSFIKASSAQLQPDYYSNTLAFMFESSLCWIPTEQAAKSQFKQHDYPTCWHDLPKNFV